MTEKREQRYVGEFWLPENPDTKMLGEILVNEEYIMVTLYNRNIFSNSQENILLIHQLNDQMNDQIDISNNQIDISNNQIDILNGDVWQSDTSIYEDRELVRIIDGIKLAIIDLKLVNKPQYRTILKATAFFRKSLTIPDPYFIPMLNTPIKVTFNNLRRFFTAGTNLKLVEEINIETTISLKDTISLEDTISSEDTEFLIINNARPYNSSDSGRRIGQDTSFEFNHKSSNFCAKQFTKNLDYITKYGNFFEFLVLIKVSISHQRWNNHTIINTPHNVQEQSTQTTSSINFYNFIDRDTFNKALQTWFNFNYDKKYNVFKEIIDVFNTTINLNGMGYKLRSSTQKSNIIDFSYILQSYGKYKYPETKKDTLLGKVICMDVKGEFKESLKKLIKEKHITTSKKVYDITFNCLNNNEGCKGCEHIASIINDYRNHKKYNNTDEALNKKNSAKSVKNILENTKDLFILHNTLLSILIALLFKELTENNVLKNKGEYITSYLCLSYLARLKEKLPTSFI